MPANAYACRGKVRIPSRRGAKRARQRVGRSGSRMHAYFCKNCGGWHVGNTVGGPRRPPYKRERARVELE
jgi:hypothetical protein